MSGLPGQARAEQNVQVPSERMGSTMALLHTGWTDATEAGAKPQPVFSLRREPNMLLPMTSMGLSDLLRKRPETQ